MDWCQDQIKNHGLKECRPFLNPNRPSDCTEEDIYRDMNTMNDAIAQGKYRIATDL